MKPTILITGTCGFIFSNFVKHMIDKYPQYRFVGIDKIVAPYNFQNIYKHKRFTFYMGDITDNHFIDNVFKLEEPDIVIHGAAESFVGSSLISPQIFAVSNILGTQVMIDASLKYKVERFIYISTDEIMGQLGFDDKPWTEDAPIKPRNPYSATKACGELLVYAASETHGLKYNITRSSNNYGPSQNKRNLVPVCITSILNKQQIPIHGQGKEKREWIYVLDNCSAIMTIVEKSPPNEIYNVGSGFECSNLEMANRIGKELGVEPEVYFVNERPTNDNRYFIDCSKLKKLGWSPYYDFDSGIKKCVNWYLENRKFYDV
jgi:dTDP-glucose 4,6-dehydratase